MTHPLEGAEMDAMNRIRARSMVLIAVVGTAALLVAGVLAGCTSGPPSGEPGITGTITRIDQAPDGVIVLLVEAVPGSTQPVGDKASVSVEPGTAVVSIDGSDAREGLKAGMTAEVWFKGGVRESYPVQGTAAYVRIGPMILDGAVPASPTH